MIQTTGRGAGWEAWGGGLEADVTAPNSEGGQASIGTSTRTPVEE